MRLKEFTQTNHLHLQSNFSHQWFTQKMVLNGLYDISFDATNQNPASICIFENVIYHGHTVMTAGSESQVIR